MNHKLKPEPNDIVVITSDLVHGFKGKHAKVIRETQGSEHGDFMIELVDDNDQPNGVRLTVGWKSWSVKERVEDSINEIAVVKRQTRV